jgi:hypothetical protein
MKIIDQNSSKSLPVLLVILILVVIFACKVLTVETAPPYQPSITYEYLSYDLEQDPFNRVETINCAEIFGQIQWNKYTKQKGLRDNIPEEICIDYIKGQSKLSPITIQRITDMNIARISPKTIVLKDGRVLIIGGEGKEKETAEIFDPKTKTFTLIPGDISKYYKTPKRHFYDEPFIGSYTPQVYFTDPILLPNGNVYYLGSIFDTQLNRFRKAKKGVEKQLLTYARDINAGRNYDEYNYTPLKVFEDDRVLYLHNSIHTGNDQSYVYPSVYLEDPIKKTKTEINVQIHQIGNNIKVLQMSPTKYALISLKESGLAIFVSSSLLDIIDFKKGTSTNINLFNKLTLNHQTKNNSRLVIYKAQAISSGKFFAIGDFSTFNNPKINSNTGEFELENLINTGAYPDKPTTNSFIIDIESANITSLAPLTSKINKLKQYEFLQVQKDEIYYDIVDTSGPYIIVRYNHFWFLLDKEKPEKLIFYDEQLSPVQTAVRLSPNQYLILGGNDYSKTQEYSSVVYSMKTSKYAGFVKIK